jgi:hypothetical protein
MFGRPLKAAILTSLLSGVSLLGQNTCNSTKLVCLLPTALHTNPPTFNFFNQTFATEIGQLPLATPASGFIFTFDKQRGVYTASQESFGPLVAERVETIGYHKVYLALTYQRFSFGELDGNNLKNLPLVFAYPSTESPEVVTQTNNRIDIKVNQYVAFLTYGLSKKVDVSVAVPYNRIAMSVTSMGTEYSTSSSATASFLETVPGTAHGFGDVVLAAKGTVLEYGKYGVAVGGELRLPSGDAENFVGSGAVGIKPYGVFARRGKIGLHVDLAYQWNASSVLNTGANGTQHSLPGFLGYTVGTDMGLLKRLTVSADLIGQHFFDAPGISKPGTPPEQSFVPAVSLSSVEAINGGYNVYNVAVGGKANLWKNLLLIGNVTIKLNNEALRATAVPLVGLSYSF